jgi:hypothetical protein
MMYEASVPVLSHFIRGLQAILRKADAHCAARKIDPNALLSARLFPDMFPLTKQVQLVSDFAKGIGARLSGATNPSYADEEKTFEDLQARLEKTLTFLASLKKDQFADAATKTVTIKVGGNDMNFSGCRISTFTSRRRTTFSATTASTSARKTSWAAPDGVAVHER